jgi:hypothetical protein
MLDSSSAKQNLNAPVLFFPPKNFLLVVIGRIVLAKVEGFYPLVVAIKEPKSLLEVSL